MLRIACAVLALTLVPRALPAQSSGGIYTLTRHTIDTGGGRSSGGVYELSYTLGQPDAAAPMSGAIYRLQPGFWGGYAALPTNFTIFRNGFEGSP